MDGRWFSKIVISIIPLLLLAFCIYVAVFKAQRIAEAVAIILSAERPGDMEEYTKSKLPIAPEIAAYKSQFQEQIKIAIREYNKNNKYPITNLESNDKGLLCWMMAICASATKNWTQNTDNNIMGVFGLDENCSPEKSIKESARLIINIYGELCCSDATERMVDTSSFMEKYYLTKAEYYDPSYMPAFYYGFGSDFQFGYEDITGKTYMDMNPESSEQEDLETDKLSSQKMMMITACYFYGNTDIMKYWAFKYSGPDYNGAGEYIDEDTGLSHKFWDDDILNEYNDIFISKQKKDNDAYRKKLRDLAAVGTVQDMVLYEEYEDSPIIEIDTSMIGNVYKYYDAYNTKVSIGGNFGSPLGPDNDGDIILQSIDLDPNNKFGYRDVTTNSAGTVSSGDETPHLGYDIWVYKVPVYACCDGYVSDIDLDRRGTGGVYITITSNDGAYSFDYMHLQEGSVTVQYNQSVSKGQQIAVSGNTSQGDSVYGYHLHFTIRDNSDYLYIDPLFVLSGGQKESLTDDDMIIREKRLSQGFSSPIKKIKEVPSWFTTVNYTSEEVRYLAALLAHECVGPPYTSRYEGEPYAGKIAVACTVLNRVAQYEAYNTVYDAISADWQYTYRESEGGWMPGYLEALELYDKGELNEDCLSAAIEVLSGTRRAYYNGEWLDLSKITSYRTLAYIDNERRSKPTYVEINSHGFW